MPLAGDPEGKENQCIQTCQDDEFEDDFTYSDKENDLTTDFTETGKTCSKCGPLCAKCTGSADFCTECAPGYIPLDLTKGQCKVTCQANEAWLVSNECIQCSTECPNNCQEETAACFIENEFLIREVDELDEFSHYTFKF
jgi:hypothetical protein